MELVEGHDVARLLGVLCERGLPPLGFGPLVVRDVCRALAYAHALTDDDGAPLRLIHRDISPSNVMVDFYGSIKLLDFGVAKALAESTKSGTQAGVLKGKLWYMAPERLRADELDHRIDLFAAGAILYEALSGRRLLTGDTPDKVFDQLTRAKPPSSARPEVPRELDRVCMKALAVSPAARYQSADEMAHDLDACVRQLGWDREELTLVVRAQPVEPAREAATAARTGTTAGRTDAGRTDAGRTDTIEEMGPTNPRSGAMTAADSAAGEPPSVTVLGRKPPPSRTASDDEDGDTATQRRLRPPSSSATPTGSRSTWSLALTWPPSPLVLIVIAIGTAAGILLLDWIF
jgi:serine/threonine protein kinase